MNKWEVNNLKKWKCYPNSKKIGKLISEVALANGIDSDSNLYPCFTWADDKLNTVQIDSVIDENIHPIKTVSEVIEFIYSYKLSKLTNGIHKILSTDMSSTERKLHWIQKLIDNNTEQLYLLGEQYNERT